MMEVAVEGANPGGMSSARGLKRSGSMDVPRIEWKADVQLPSTGPDGVPLERNG
jgi:hypothetical protein